MTKADLMDISFYQIHLEEKENLTEGTIYVYVQAITRFLKYNPDVDDIAAYNDFLIKYSRKKRNHYYYSALRYFVDYKIADKPLKIKLKENLIKPKEDLDIIRKRRHLDKEQLLEIIFHMQKQKHQIIALIQYMTGVRVGDIMRTKRDNIKYENYKEKEVLRLNLTGKKKKIYVVYIFEKEAQKMIMDYIDSVYNFDDYYFIELGLQKNRPGQTENEDGLLRMNYMRYWLDLKQALDAAGIDKDDFSSHDFRRCYARRFYEKTKDPYRLMNLLNHSDMTTTMKYLKQSGMHTVDDQFSMQNEY